MRVFRTRLPTFGFSIGLWPFKGIVLGRFAMLLSQDEIAAIIAHEEGHIVYWHAMWRLWWIVTFRWVNPLWISKQCRQQEHEADLYACRKGHAEGLLKFLRRCTISHDNPLHPTIPERIEHITRYHYGPDRRVPTAG